MLKQAVSTYGIPDRLYTDNGSPYIDKQLSLICGSIGTVLLHAPVRDGAAKAEVTINIGGQALSVEVTVEVYEHLDRADHKEENLAHEKRRHWDSREFDEYIVLTEGRSCYYQTPEQWVCRKETILEIKAALALCTEAQRRRFLLYALEGLSYAEIAGLCRCSKAAIQDSKG